MANPRFSVVIPTREGASTLKYTLQSCLHQEFDDFEIVVCDNFSSPATKNVVDELASAKIKYVRADKPLAMSSNWELAVSHASGEFVTVLGDDDALLPHALRVLDYLLKRFETRAIRWDAAFYLWPTIALPEEANYLRLPLTNKIEKLDGREAIKGVMRFDWCYTSLPMLYNSVVNRGLLDVLRKRTGRLFLNRYPDVGSGFMIAATVGEYLSISMPMSIAGLSHKSVGVGHHLIPKQNAVGQEFLQLNSAEGVGVRRMIPDLHVFPVIPVADCFLSAKEALFSDDDGLVLDRKTIVKNCVWCLRVESLEQWHSCLATIRATMTDDPNLQAWFDQEFAHYTPNISGHLRLRSERLGFADNHFHLDASTFGVDDVFAAAQLCGRLLGIRADDLGSRFNLSDTDRNWEMGQTELDQKEKEIQALTAQTQNLFKVAGERLDLINRLDAMNTERLRSINDLSNQLVDMRYQLAQQLVQQKRSLWKKIRSRLRAALSSLPIRLGARRQ